MAACLLGNSVRLLAMLVGLSRIGVSFSLINPALPARALSIFGFPVSPILYTLEGRAREEYLMTVIRGEKTSDQTVVTLVALAEKAGAPVVMPRLGQPFEPARFERIDPRWREVAAPKGQVAAAVEAEPEVAADASVPWPLD